MRYDDFDEYDSRSSRSRRSGASYPPSSRSREYERDYGRSSERDRQYAQDYGYDRRRTSRESYEYDRRSSSRQGHDYDYNRRSSSRSSDRYRQDDFDNFDRRDWERTSPNWDDRSSATPPRRRREPSPPPRSGGNRKPPQNRRRPPEPARRSSGKRRTPTTKQKGNHLSILPIVLGLIIILAAFLIIRSVFGGHGGGDYAISFSNQCIVIGETAEATITGLPDGEVPEITWSSNDSNVVTANGKGTTCTLTAKNEGQVTIAANIDGEIVSGTVQVVKTAVGVVQIHLPQETVEIKSGETYTINATVEMEEGLSPAKVSWSSDDASIARVSDDGIITARDIGQTIVKATAGEKTAEMVVTVIENPSAIPDDRTSSTGQAPEEGAELPEDTSTPQDVGTEMPAETPAETPIDGSSEGEAPVIQE